VNIVNGPTHVLLFEPKKEAQTNIGLVRRKGLATKRQHGAAEFEPMHAIQGVGAAVIAERNLDRVHRLHVAQERAHIAGGFKVCIAARAEESIDFGRVEYCRCEMSIQEQTKPKQIKQIKISCGLELVNTSHTRTDTEHY
jgi:hypothetical protein